MSEIYSKQIAFFGDKVMSFDQSKNGIFLFKKGPAFEEGKAAPCQWKICITATDEDYLASKLLEISKRSDCYYVKYSPATSPKSRDGMMLGRVFLLSLIHI